MLSWQNIWKRRQIAADIKEKNQSYLPFLFKQMETMPRSFQKSPTYSQKDTGKAFLISLKL